MPRWCEPLVIDGKVAGFVCGSSPTRRCSTCRKRATIQCDYPVKSKSGTCDRWCCRSCAKSVGPDSDYCPAHARAHAPDPEQQALPFGLSKVKP